jgi:hypothetical protein
MKEKEDFTFEYIFIAVTIVAGVLLVLAIRFANS